MLPANRLTIRRWCAPIASRFDRILLRGLPGSRGGV
jgi:hypothetical protein